MENKIVRYFFVEVLEELEKDEYFTYILDSLKIQDSEAFLQVIYNDRIATTENIKKELTICKRKFKQKKKRWVQSAKDGLKNKHKAQELSIYKASLLSEYQLIGAKNFNKKYQANDILDVIQQCLISLQEWANSCAPFYQYRYFSFKSEKVQYESFVDDLTIIMMNQLVKHYDANPKNVIEEMPGMLVGKPVTQSKKTKKGYNFTEDIKKIKNENYRAHNYQIQVSPNSVESISFLTLFKVDYSMHRIIPFLDQNDLRILSLILKQRSTDFLVARQISVDVNQIVRELYGESRSSISSKYYLIVEKRIIKLTNLFFNFSEEKDGFNIFNRYQYRDINGKRFMILSISDALYEDYAKLQTVRVYSKQLKQLKNKELSRSLVYSFQKYRFSLYSLGLPLEKKCDYTYFMLQAQFPYKKKLDNLKLIQSCLDEIVAAGVIIYKYERIGENFKVYFKPVHSYEVEDLIYPYIDMEKSLLNTSE